MFMLWGPEMERVSLAFYNLPTLIMVSMVRSDFASIIIDHPLHWGKIIDFNTGLIDQLLHSTVII